MKQRILSLLTLLLMAIVTVSAQDLTVKSFGVAQGDISASAYPRNDRNEEPCGLIKVQLPLQGATFEGNVMGETSFIQGEYWVYMSRTSYRLSILHPQFHRLDLNLRELMPAAEDGFRGVEPKVTYNLVINVPQTGLTEVDDGKRYLVLTVQPANSRVLIDGQEAALDAEGKAMVRLYYGRHTYVVTATGYSEERGEVVVEEGSPRTNKSISLQTSLSQVTVSCPTTGAQIYVNDLLRGASPWSGQLPQGDYLFEARLDGYRTGKVSKTVAERERLEITIPALAPFTGTLDVSFRPADAEVWIDGRHVGTSPYIFRNLTVGSHQVELRADGYDTKRETVTIREGQTTQLSGQLERSQTASNTLANTSSLDNRTILPFTVTGNGKTVTFNMVLVKAGTFQMGSTTGDENEQPVHSVTLTKDYYMGETEVTQELWYAVMGQKPTSDGSQWENEYGLGDNYPAYYISYEDCRQFIAKLNQMTGRQFRFPTEAEWEFAARGGTKSKGNTYAGSNTIGDVAWYDRYDKNASTVGSLRKNNYGTHTVKTKTPNELGLYDMSGNVWEWCYDWYGSYPSSAQTDPTGPDCGSNRVVRGGSWYNGATYCRTAFRGSYTPSSRYGSLGFRLAL